MTASHRSGMHIGPGAVSSTADWHLDATGGERQAAPTQLGIRF